VLSTPDVASAFEKAAPNDIVQLTIKATQLEGWMQCSVYRVARMVT